MVTYVKGETTGGRMYALEHELHKLTRLRLPSTGLAALPGTTVMLLELWGVQ